MLPGLLPVGCFDLRSRFTHFLLPQRCSIAPESKLVEPEIRQYLFGKWRNIYRALFSVTEKEVRILHVRWGGMQFATRDDLTE